LASDASVEEGPPVLEEQAPRTAIASGESRKPARPKVSMCQALGALKDQQSPSVVFNLGNCAEENERLSDAARLFERYLENCATSDGF